MFDVFSIFCHLSRSYSLSSIAIKSFCKSCSSKERLLRS
jgi:hypothetical protein